MLPHFPKHDAKVKADLPVPDRLLEKRKNKDGKDVDFMLSDWIVEKLFERDLMRDERLNKRIDQILAVIDSSDPKNVQITAGHLRAKLATGWRDMFLDPSDAND